MLELIAHSPLGFWTIAFLLIVFDSTLLVAPDRFTYTFARRLNVKIRVVENPFLLRNKEPIITLFAHSFVPFFVSSLVEPTRSKAVIKQLLLQQKRMVSESGPLAILAAITLGLVCLAGPFVSLQYGVERALILVVPPIYVSAMLGLATVCWNRTLFGLSKRSLALMLMELLVCPVLLVNVFKRIARHQPQLRTLDLLGSFAVDRFATERRLEHYIEATAK